MCLYVILSLLHLFSTSIFVITKKFVVPDNVINNFLITSWSLPVTSNHESKHSLYNAGKLIFKLEVCSGKQNILQLMTEVCLRLLSKD